jgi:hypothetical protein
MQALIEFIAGFIALLAAAVLSQFGVDSDQPRRQQEREVHRVRDCPEGPSTSVLVAARRDC